MRISGPPGAAAHDMSADPAAYREYWAVRGYEIGWTFTPLDGKRPICRRWQCAARPTMTQVREWARAGNIGLLTGKISGVVVIDLDAVPNTEWAYLPDTPTVITGRESGRHLYFRMPDRPIGNTVSLLAPGIDTRGDGGQVVFVGSIHPNTERLYHWAPGFSPDDLDLPSLPSSVIERLRPNHEGRPREQTTIPEITEAYVRTALENEVEAIRAASEGSRNNTLNRSAFSLARFVAAGRLSGAAVATALFDAATGVGLPEEEVRATIRSGLAAGIKGQS